MNLCFVSKWTIRNYSGSFSYFNQQRNIPKEFQFDFYWFKGRKFIFKEKCYNKNNFQQLNFLGKNYSKPNCYYWNSNIMKCPCSWSRSHTTYSVWEVTVQQKCVTAIIEDSSHGKRSAILDMICFITNYVPFCVSKIAL